jgi:hypothetical protein
MRKIVFIVSLMMIALSLNACKSSAISNQQLITDILLIPKLYPMDEIKDFSIIEKTETDSEISYKISATLISEHMEITTDISMKYIYFENKWKMNHSSVNIVNILAYDLPSLDKAVESIPDYFYLVSHTLSLYYLHGPVTLDSMEDDLAHGKAILNIRSGFTDEYFMSQIEFRIEAIYDYEDGWEYRLVDYSSIETMKWDGTYKILWTEKEPSGMIPKNPYFEVGNEIQNIMISGFKSRQTRMDGTEETTNTIEVKIEINDTKYNLQGYSYETNWHTNEFVFKFEEGYGGEISLRYKPKNDTLPSRFIAYSDAILGELISKSTQ